MKVWELKRTPAAESGPSIGMEPAGFPPEVATLLADGWEPFAVSDGWLYVRRHKRETGLYGGPDQD